MMRAPELRHGLPPIRVAKISSEMLCAMLEGRKPWELKCRLSACPKVLPGDRVLLCPNGHAGWNVAGVAVVRGVVTWPLSASLVALEPHMSRLSSTEKCFVRALVRSWVLRQRVSRVQLVLLDITDLRSRTVQLTEHGIGARLPNPFFCSHLPSLQLTDHEHALLDLLLNPSEPSLAPSIE